MSGEHDKCGDDSVNSEKISENTKKVDPYIVTNFTFQQIGIAEKKEKSCNKADDTAKCRDLRAQETVAFWSLPVFVAGLFSVIGLLLTIAQGKKANRIAMIAVSKDRAWFLPHSFDDLPIINEEGEELGTNVFCTFKNSGNSPAMRVNILNTIRLGMSVEDCLAGIDSLIADAGSYTQAVIGPNETCQTTMQELPANIVRIIMEEKTTAVYAVIATYRDIFDPQTERRSESYQRISFTQRQNGEDVTSLLPIFESIPQRADTIT